MSNTEERELEWIKKKYGEDPRRWDSLLNNRWTIKDQKLALELVRMGAPLNPRHVEYSLFFCGGEEEIREAIEVLAEALVRQAEEDGFEYIAPIIERLLREVRGNPERFALLKPLAIALANSDLKEKGKYNNPFYEIVLYPLSQAMPEGVKMMEGWGVFLGKLPLSAEDIFSKTAPLDIKEREDRQVAILEVLLKQGLLADGPEESPLLHRACEHFSNEDNALRAVKLLLDFGANPLGKDKAGKYATFYCKHPKVIERLLELGIPVDELDPISFEVLSRKNLKLALQLVGKITAEEGQDASLFVPKEFVHENRRSYLAKELFIKRIIEEDLDKEELLNRLGLFEEARVLGKLVYVDRHTAKFRGDLEKLLTLYSWSLSKDIKIHMEWLALGLRRGASREELKMLMEGRKGRELLMEASSAWAFAEPFGPKGHPEHLSTLIWLSYEAGAAYVGWKSLRAYLEAGGNPNASVNWHEETILQQAIAEMNVEAVELLLESGADPNFMGPKGIPPIHYLVRHHKEGYRPIHRKTEDLFVLLVARGADPEARDLNGLTLKEVICEAIKYSKRFRFGRAGESIEAELRDFSQKLSQWKSFVRGRLLGSLQGL